MLSATVQINALVFTTLSIIANAQLQVQFINQMALVPFEATELSINFEPCQALSAYAIHYSLTSFSGTVNFTTAGRESRGYVAKSISAWHPLGYPMAQSSEMYALYPGNWNLRAYYAPRVALPTGINHPVSVRIDNDGSASSSMLVLLQNDDYGNDVRSAYPLLLNAETNSFAEIAASIDYPSDEDFFMVAIVDPVSTARRRVYFWSETPLGQSTTDVWGVLYDRNGVFLEDNDDQTDSIRNFGFFADIDPNAVYFVRVRGYSSSDIGRYIFRYSTVAYQSSQLLSRTAPTTGLSYAPTVATTNDGATAMPSTTSFADVQFPSLVPEITFACLRQNVACANGEAGQAIVQHLCLPHVSCNAGRPSTIQSCVNTCTDPSAVISTTVCPPPPTYSTSSSSSRSRTRSSSRSSSSSSNAEPSGTNSIRPVLRRPTSETSESSAGVFGAYTGVVFAVIGCIGAVLVSVAVYMIYARRKAQAVYVDPYAFEMPPSYVQTNAKSGSQHNITTNSYGTTNGGYTNNSGYY